ncbi:Nucleoprotein TPR, partial [Folsomia candida]
MAKLNCLLCLDNGEGEHFTLNYLNSTQIIHLYDLLVPKDRNSRQDLIANCPSEENYGFTLCQNCSFETTQVEQIREQISQLEEDVRLKVVEIRSKMVHCPDVKELSPGLSQVRTCFLTCLSSDGGHGDIQDDDFQ